MPYIPPNPDVLYKRYKSYKPEGAYSFIADNGDWSLPLFLAHRLKQAGKELSKKEWNHFFKEATEIRKRSMDRTYSPELYHHTHDQMYSNDIDNILHKWSGGKIKPLVEPEAPKLAEPTAPIADAPTRVDPLRVQEPKPPAGSGKIKLSKESRAKEYNEWKGPLPNNLRDLEQEINYLKSKERSRMTDPDHPEHQRLKDAEEKLKELKKNQVEAPMEKNERVKPLIMPEVEGKATPTEVQPLVTPEVEGKAGEENPLPAAPEKAEETPEPQTPSGEEKKPNQFNHHLLPLMEEVMENGDEGPTVESIKNPKGNLYHQTEKAFDRRYDLKPNSREAKEYFKGLIQHISGPLSGRFKKRILDSSVKGQERHAPQDNGAGDDSHLLPFIDHEIKEFYRGRRQQPGDYNDFRTLLHLRRKGLEDPDNFQKVMDIWDKRSGIDPKKTTPHYEGYINPEFRPHGRLSHFSKTLLKVANKYKNSTNTPQGEAARVAQQILQRGYNATTKNGEGKTVPAWHELGRLAQISNIPELQLKDENSKTILTKGKDLPDEQRKPRVGINLPGGRHLAFDDDHGNLEVVDKKTGRLTKKPIADNVVKDSVNHTELMKRRLNGPEGTGLRDAVFSKLFPEGTSKEHIESFMHNPEFKDYLTRYLEAHSDIPGNPENERNYKESAVRNLQEQHYNPEHELKTSWNEDPELKNVVDSINKKNEGKAHVEKETPSNKNSFDLLGIGRIKLPDGRIVFGDPKEAVKRYFDEMHHIARNEHAKNLSDVYQRVNDLIREHGLTDNKYMRKIRDVIHNANENYYDQIGEHPDDRDMDRLVHAGKGIIPVETELTKFFRGVVDKLPSHERNRYLDAAKKLAKQRNIQFKYNGDIGVHFRNLDNSELKKNPYNADKSPKEHESLTHTLASNVIHANREAGERDITNPKTVAAQDWLVKHVLSADPEAKELGLREKVGASLDKLKKAAHVAGYKIDLPPLPAPHKAVYGEVKPPELPTTEDDLPTKPKKSKVEKPSEGVNFATRVAATNAMNPKPQTPVVPLDHPINPTF